MAQVQNSQGNSDGALASYHKALGLLREIGMNKEVGDTLMDMGTLLSDRGQTDQALAAFQEALRVQRESGDENFEALSLSNIAQVYEARGDTGSALTYYQQALQLREKLAVPGFLAETLAGLGRTYAYDGNYDEAVKSFVRGLDLTRKAGDPREGVRISDAMGLVFADEGRYGAAVNSMQDAIKASHDLGDQKSRDFVLLVNDLAVTLARAGRLDEATVALNAAQQPAVGLPKNAQDAIPAHLLNTQGEIALYRNHLVEARQAFQRAEQDLGHRNERNLAALLQLNLARTALAQNNAKEAERILTPPTQPVALPRSLALQITATRAQAMIRSGDPVRARQMLLNTLSETEKAGMKLETARIYYALSLTSKTNPEEAASFAAHAVQTIDNIRALPGSDKLLNRADLNAIYQASVQAAATAHR
jgi:tetratricopeptide (TPR) repeat protein